MKKNCCICRMSFKIPEKPKFRYEYHSCKKCIRALKNTNHPLYKENEMKITSYYIDDNNTLHTYCGEYKHITMKNVRSDKDAERLIKELNEE